MYPTSSLVSHENFKDETQTPNMGALAPATRGQTEPQSVSPKSAPFLYTKSAADQHFPNFPKLGSMEFNDAQKAHWEKHTPPKVSKKIQKLAMLRDIARDQEKAGLHFERRRSLAEAEADLAKEQITLSSQASRAQDPFSFIRNSIKSLADGFNYYFQSGSSIPQLASELSKPIEGKQFVVRKSEALAKREAASEEITSLGVGLVDSNHASIEVQQSITVFLANHFKPERGDVFLTEAVAVYENENGKDKVVQPTVEKHHASFCHGVPIQFCRFLREPEKETADLLAVLAERRDLVNKIFEFLMSAISPAKALEAHEKLSARNKAVATEDTEFKISLMIDYQHFCDPSKQERLQRRIEPLTRAIQKVTVAEAAAAKSRDTTYFRQITEMLKVIRPGAKLYYTMGKAHFQRLDSKLNQMDGFFIDIANPDDKDEF